MGEDVENYYRETFELEAEDATEAAVHWSVDKKSASASWKDDEDEHCKETEAGTESGASVSG